MKCPKCMYDNPADTVFCGKCGTHLPTPQDHPRHKTDQTFVRELITGSIFAGRYRVIEELGHGGMGVVYKTEDVKLQRTVALKFLPESLALDHQAVERFKREARAASALNHPNICTIYDIDEHEGKHFIALEFLEGKTLRKHVLGKRLDLDQIIDLGIQVSNGLDAAHTKGIIHRDIKPSNIFVTDSGQAKILDFGLAKLLPERRPKTEEKVALSLPTMTAEELLTSPGSAVGTVAYMSPEQALGKKLDTRTDLFSLGVVLYEIATGIPPFRGDSSAAIFDGILHAAPASPMRLNPDLPAELERIIDKALEKDREVRYQSAREVVVDLKRLKRDTDSGKVATQAPVPKRKPSFGKPKIKYALAIGTLFLAAIASYLIWKPGRDVRIPSLGRSSYKQITFLGNAFDPGLSPDGKSIAYVTRKEGEEARLMLEDISGGQAVELLRSKELGSPKWSPDGTQLMLAKYNADGSPEITIIPRLGGEARIISEGWLACWSPDGIHIAMAGKGEKSFRVVDRFTDESKPISLKDIPWKSTIELEWADAANLLAVLTAMENGRTAVWTIRPDGSQLRKVVEDEAISSVRWSSTGDAIYFFCSKNGAQELAKLFINPKTGEARGEPSALLNGLQAGDNFTISMDRTRLAYTRAQRLPENLWLGEWPGPGKDRNPKLRPLTIGTVSFYEPSISPDGKWIAFAGGLPAKIYKMPIGGGTPIQLTFSNFSSGRPAWSPDGKRIAFGTVEGTNCRVWIINSDGGNPRPLIKTDLSPDNIQAIIWSPGHDILYNGPKLRNFTFVDPETGQQKPLVRDESVGFVFHPIYSPDGKKVAAYWTGKPRGLCVISLANNERKFLGGGEGIIPVGWSPDGKWIYTQSHEHPGVIWAIPVSGGEPETFMNVPSRVSDICVGPDARKFVYSNGEILSDVWLVENFDPYRK